MFFKLNLTIIEYALPYEVYSRPISEIRSACIEMFAGPFSCPSLLSQRIISGIARILFACKSHSRIVRALIANKSRSRRTKSVRSLSKSTPRERIWIMAVAAVFSINRSKNKELSKYPFDYQHKMQALIY